MSLLLQSASRERAFRVATTVLFSLCNDKIHLPQKTLPVCISKHNILHLFRLVNTFLKFFNFIVREGTPSTALLARLVFPRGAGKKHPHPVRQHSRQARTADRATERTNQLDKNKYLSRTIHNTYYASFLFLK